MDDCLDSWPEPDCFAVDFLDVEVAFDDAESPYGDLSRETNEIRLVEVLPGNTSAPVRCRISTYAINEVPEYTALSYTWGRPDPDCTIELNDHRAPVRKNLWRFLHQIRRLSQWHGTKFWIDAICINQSESNERSHQVGLMAQIYSGALRVLVWLGPGYAHGDVAFRALRSVNQRPSRKFWWRSEGAGLRQLCERSYWTRLWVVQELVIAKDTTLLCGAESLPWQALIDVIDGNVSQIRTYRQQTNLELEATMNSRAASMIAQIRQAKDVDSLWKQVLFSTHLGCSELKDKVFALLGTAGYGHEQIIPNYDLPLYEVLNSVVRNKHRHAKPLSLLDIKKDCRTLSDAFRVHPAYMYRLRGVHSSSSFDFKYFPLLDRKSGLSFWWGISHKHEAMQEMWLRDNDPIGLQVALSHAARLGEERLCRLLLDSWQFSIVEEDIAYFGRSYRHPLVEAASRGFLNIAKLLLPRHAGRPGQALLEATYSSCIENGHAETALALLGTQLAAAHNAIEPVIPLVRAAMVHNDTCLVQKALEASQQYQFSSCDIHWLAHVVVRGTINEGQDLDCALLDAIRMLRKNSFGPLIHAEQLLPENNDSYVLACSIGAGLTKQACQLIERLDVDVDSPCYCQPHYSCFPKLRATPLELAIRCCSVPVVKALLSRGVSVKPNLPSLAINMLNKAPISRSKNDPLAQEELDRWKSSFGILEMLLVRYPGMHISPEWRRVGLSCAIRDSRPGLVVLLLKEKGMTIDWRDRLEGLLALAVQLNFEQIVEVLIEEPDLDVNRKSWNNDRTSYKDETILIQAVRQGSTRIVELLLRRNDLDVALVDYYGGSAIWYAIKAESVDMVRLLLSHKSNACRWGDFDGDKLVEQAMRIDNEQILQALLELASFSLDPGSRTTVKERYPLLYDTFI